MTEAEAPEQQMAQTAKNRAEERRRATDIEYELHPPTTIGRFDPSVDRSM